MLRIHGTCPTPVRLEIGDPWLHSQEGKSLQWWRVLAVLHYYYFFKGGFFLFIYFLATLLSMRDLCSPTRD